MAGDLRGRLPQMSRRRAVLRWLVPSLAIALVVESVLGLIWSHASGWLSSITGDWIVDLYFSAMILAFCFLVGFVTARYLAAGRRSRS